MTKTHITLIVDRSGSMQSTREDAQGGIDSFVAEFQRLESEEGIGVTLALWEFDQRIDQAVAPVLASAWGGYTLTPRGSTALLDGIGVGVAGTRDYLASLPLAEQPEKVVVAIVTDGGENASREWSKERVESLIAECKDRGWEFMFLASDLSAIDTAQTVGLGGHTMTYAATGAGTRTAYGAMTRSVSAYVSGAMPSPFSPGLDAPEAASAGPGTSQ